VAQVVKSHVYLADARRFLNNVARRIGRRRRPKLGIVIVFVTTQKLFGAPRRVGKVTTTKALASMLTRRLAVNVTATHTLSSEG
jgi:hypothetical protein